MSSTNTIILEDKLDDIFQYLPAMVVSENSEGYKPVFHFGDEHEIKVFLKKYELEKRKPYPLIWLLYPFKEKHIGKTLQLEDLPLILAVDTDKNLSSKLRLKTTYKKVLIPLMNMVVESLTKASTVKINKEREFVKFPNYSDDLLSGEENFTGARWDAIKLYLSFSINNGCLREIKMKGNQEQQLEINIPAISTGLNNVLKI